MNEFELIKHYFYQKPTRPDVFIGNGDDCAILKISEPYQIAMSIDTLVSGVHFDHHFSARDIGYKSLAVNLSDLAASGAEPAWIMLSLTLPIADESFLSGFSAGFFELFSHYSMDLIGGDITRGGLSITIQVTGYTPRPILRSGAKPGDLIYVTHEVGDAVLALQHLQHKIALNAHDAEKVLPRLFRPTPRIHEGIVLRDFATSCIDISDGLSGDLQHILNASHVGATIFVDQIPISDTLRQQPLSVRHDIALNCGDSYELCFTAPKHIAMPSLPCKITCIGEITDKNELALLDDDGKRIHLANQCFKHF